MANYSYGLKGFKIGAIAEDGGLGTSLAAIGNTVKGSFNITSDEAQTKDFFIEEDDNNPILTLQTQPATLTVAGEIYDVSPATAVKLLGGTAASGGYTPPDTPTAIEVSAEAETDNGVLFKIVRLRIFARWEWQFTSEELGKIAFTAKVLKPTKAATAPYTVTMPA